MLGRRLLILVAVLMGLTALAATIAPRDGDLEPAVTSTSPSPTPAAEASPREPPADAPAVAGERDVPGEPPLRTLDAQGSGQLVEAKVGERIRLAISSDALATVQVGTGGRIEPIDPDSPARYELRFDAPVREEIRLLGDDLRPVRTIGVVRVR